MNKQINFITEFLAKSNDMLYKNILDFFTKNYIYIPTKYEIKTIKILAHKSGIYVENGYVLLEEILNVELNAQLIDAKKQLFDTIIQSNFKKEKEYFDKVDTSIFKLISAYIVGLSRALDLFLVYTKNKSEVPEVFIEYANYMHNYLLNNIFNTEEKRLLEDKLKEVMNVYLTLYGRYIFDEQ